MSRQPLPQVAALRACELCTEHRTIHGELHCSCRAVAGGALVVPCLAARRPHGGCGPDALHLNYPAIESAPLRRMPRPEPLWVAA